MNFLKRPCIQYDTINLESLMVLFLSFSSFMHIADIANQSQHTFLHNSTVVN